MAEWRERGYVPDSDEEDEVGHVEGSSTTSTSRDRNRNSRSDDAVAPVENLNRDHHLSLVDTDGSRSGSGQPSNHGVVTKEQNEQQPPTNVAKCDADGIPSNIAHASVDLKVFTTAEKLETQLQRGLETVQEVLRLRTQSPAVDDSASTLSSPLSSPPSSPEGSPQRRHPFLPNYEDIQSSTGAGAVDQNRPDSVLTNHLSGRRSLRDRNPIQIHPYLIELAKHQQEFRDRGLPPVRVPQTAGDHRLLYPEEESQETDTFQSSQMGSLSIPSPQRKDNNASQDESQSPVRGIRGAEATLDPTSDDELPDISAILQGRTAQTGHSVADGSRRAGKPRRPRPLQPRERFRTHKLPTERKAVRSDMDIKDSVLDLPPSPPHSDSLTSPITIVGPPGREEARVHRTPHSLPTPVLSSGRQIQKRNINEISSSSQDDSETAGSGEGSQSSDSGSGDEDSQGIVQIRRKIKGVLPASWLKLDALRQKSGIDKKRMPRSPDDAIEEKGVAKHVRSSIREPTARLPLDLTSDVEMNDQISESEAENIAHDISAYDGRATDDFDLFAGDVVEDNMIDHMLPSGDTRPREMQLPKRRQRRLEGTWVGARPGGTNRDRAAASRTKSDGLMTAGRKFQNRPRKRPKKQLRQPQLSILDAPGFAERQRHAQPRFLKVAARSRVQSQRNLVQDPAWKFLQLATREDTVDVNEELVFWRDGHNAQRRNVQPLLNGGSDLRLDPLPAQPRCGSRHRGDDQSGQNYLFSDKNTHALKISTAATLSRLRLASSIRTGPVPQPDLHQRRSLLPVTRPLGAFFAHLNRSGRGKLLNNVHSRPAQLEAPHLQPRTARLAIRPIKRLIPNHFRPSSEVPEFNMVRPENQQKSTPAAVAQRASSRRKRKHRPARSMEQELVVSPDFDEQAIQFRPKPAVAAKTSTTDVDELIELATNLVPILKPLESSSSFKRGTFIGRGFLTMTQECFIEHKPYKPAVPITMQLITPATLRKLTSVAWSPEVTSFVTSIFEEVAEFALASRNEELLPRTRLTTEPLSAFLKSLNSIVFYINKNFALEGSPQSTLFVSAALDSMESLVRALESVQQAGRKPDELCILHLLNTLMVISWQLRMIACRDEGEEIKTKAVNISADVSCLAISLALRSETIKEVLQAVVMRSDSHPLRESTAFGMEYPEIESVVIILELLRFDRDWSSELNNMLSARINEVAGQTPARLLAFTMLTLRVICPLSCFRRDGKFGGLKPPEVRYACWEVLMKPVATFLDEYTKPEGAPMRSSQDLGMAALRFCFSLLTFWKWREADNILKLLFSVYAKQDMTELFVAPELGKSNFLAQGPNAVKEAEKNDTDFDFFLKMTAITLQQIQAGLTTATTDGDTAKIRLLERRARSLIFSLSPNNSRNLVEDQDLKHADLIAMDNTYKLYETLYRFAPPGFETRLLQIEVLINFSRCHREVCKLTLNAWTQMVRHAITTPGFEKDLRDFGLWIERMVLQIVKKFTSIRTNALQDLSKKNIEWDASAESVIQANRQITALLIAELLDAWKDAVKLCATESAARSLLSADHLDTIIMLSQNDDLNAGHPVSNKIFDLAAEYLQKPDFGDSQAGLKLHERIRASLRQVLCHRLSSRLKQSSSALRAMIKAWFNLAQASVQSKAKTWDDYLTAPASLSFGILADTQYSRQCKVLFISHLIAEDPMYFELDRASFYTTWIESLLQPREALMFENVLTQRMITHDPNTLSLAKLHSVLSDDRGNLNLTIEDIVQARLDIIKHAIRNIYSLQFEDRNDSQDLLESRLDKVQGRMLLKVITTTMRSTWHSLAGEARAEFTLFVQAVIAELQIYKYSNFVIDPWFTDEENTEFPKKRNKFTELFVRPAGAPQRSLDRAVVVLFRVICLDALIGDYGNALSKDLTGMLSCTDYNLLDDNGVLLIDVPLQLQFIQNILSVYIEQAFAHDANLLLAMPILRALENVYRVFHLRIDLETPESYTRWFPVTLTLLTSVRKSLQSVSSRVLPDADAYKMLLSAMIFFVATILRQWGKLSAYLVSSGIEIPSAADAAVGSLAGAIYKLTHAQGIAPTIAADQFEPELAPADVVLRNIASNDLAASIAADWRPARGAGGVDSRWLVRHGGADALLQRPLPTMVAVRNDSVAAMAGFVGALEELGLLEAASEGVAVAGLLRGE